MRSTGPFLKCLSAGCDNLVRYSDEVRCRACQRKARAVHYATDPHSSVALKRRRRWAEKQAAPDA